MSRAASPVAAIQAIRALTGQEQPAPSTLRTAGDVVRITALGASSPKDRPAGRRSGLMEMTKDALSDAVEKLRRRLSTGGIDEVEFRRLRDQLLERRATPRPFGGPEQRSTPPPDS